jgi:hypothetical protein
MPLRALLLIAVRPVHPHDPARPAFHTAYGGCITEVASGCGSTTQASEAR